MADPQPGSTRPRRLAVIGGSGASTPELAEALVAWPGGPERRPALEVALQGRDPAKLELVAGAFSGRAGTRHGDRIAVRTTTRLDEALEGADAVLVQVRIGGLAARVFDETFPREEGIPGEETMGPGGFANALRTVPALRPTWEAIARCAPRSLVVDLTNPAGIVTASAVRETGLRIVSVCDSPMTLTDGIAARLGRDSGTVRAGYVGGNHFGWWAPDDAGDLAAVADLATEATSAEAEAFGALPAPYDRYYLVPDRILAGQLGSPTRAEQLMSLERDMLAAYAAGPAPMAEDQAAAPPRRGAVWYSKAVVPLLDAAWNGGDAVTIAGLVNDGWAAGLPRGVVVEGAVRVAVGSIERFAAPELPPFPAALLHAHLAYEALVVEALASGASRSSLGAALAANPMVRDLERAGRLVDTILASSPA